MVGFYLVNVNVNLKKSIQELNDTKEIELKKLFDAERKKIKDDIGELHRADMVSYQAMAKRMEMEKKKAREMQEKLKELKKEDDEGKKGENI